MAAHVGVSPPAACRGTAKAKGDTDVAIKQITCLRWSTEQEVRRELEALRKVRDLGLEACLPLCDAYVEQAVEDGGLNYLLTMPCATVPSHSCPFVPIPILQMCGARTCLLVQCGECIAEATVVKSRNAS